MQTQRNTFTTTLNNVGVNLQWNGRKAIETNLMDLAVDIAVNGQDKPAEVVSMAKVRAMATETPWLAEVIKGFSTEVEWMLLAGHRRYMATELAVTRELVGPERANGFFVEDITAKIHKASDLRRINIRENAQQKPKTPAEDANDILRMRDVEGIPVEEIAEFYGRKDDKGIRWVKEAAKLAKDLHPSVFESLKIGTIQWSTAVEYSKMPQDEQARAIHKGLVKVAEIKAERAEKAGRTPRVGGSVGYKSTKDQLAGLDAVLDSNKSLRTTSAEWQMIHAFTERLRGGASMAQFIAKLTRIHDNGNLETGLLKLKADKVEDSEALADGDE